jgi:uncharacterized membrane protein
VNKKQRKRAAKKALRAASVVKHQQPAPIEPDLVIDVDATRMAPNNQQKITRQVQAFSFSGPLPPPQLLSQYNDVVPNGAERLMKMAEVQQTHRQDLERTVVHGNVKSEKRGQWMGLAISLVVITAGSYLAANGKQITGGLLVGVDVVALASVFVYGKQTQRRQLEEKKEPLKRK